MKNCANKRCGEWIGDQYNFCPSCRFIARWAFALGAFLAGAVAAVIKFIA